jgi:cyclopropane fatty-acyl-phospholipid synthase-like methyltransferase
MAEYFLGHSQIELRRLMAQAEALRPITKRLLRRAGLLPGMRVLDLGCGAGDVSMLAAELMGGQGAVVGIDRAGAAIRLAQERAERGFYRNLTFRQCAADDLADALPFDFVIGRYVVLHQPEPARFIRGAAARLRKGGMIAFHEIDMRTRFETLPAVLRYDAVTAEFMAAISAGVPHPDAAARLVALFAEAGLPEPSVFCERPAGGSGASTLHRWVATTLASIRSLTQPRATSIEVDDLEAELKTAVAKTHSQVLAADQCCAWASV